MTKRKHRRLTVSEIKEAKRLRQAGMSFTHIADRYGSSRDIVQRAIDPSYPDRRRRQAERSRRREKGYVGGHVVIPSRRPSPEDLSARLAEIPADTRSLTGQLLGDPLPGRSALSPIKERERA